uniref:Uncharacterized protein n=1 Tax=Oryza glumipatula TaxID=40148 RepID=A0A0E0A0X1_9ORYZ
MEMRPRDLAAVLAMSCLLLLPLLVSSVPVPGIVHLSSQQQHPSSRNIYADVVNLSHVLQFLNSQIRWQQRWTWR